ncbi:hypothetical protein ACA30_15740 [Virgibacillus soli]|nr:hypothetical protein ACA30_15740 [Virgibacillus soli]
MNDFNDVREIIKTHLVRGSELMKNPFNLSEVKKAEGIWEEGLSKLKSLKLSTDDRRNYRLIRKAFEASIKAAKAHQKGQHDKASILTDEASNYAQRYSAAVIARAVKRDG